MALYGVPSEPIEKMEEGREMKRKREKEDAKSNQGEAS